jgi:hypothetical protein
VTDPTGATIPGAEISAKNATTEDTFTAKTGNEGDYLLRNLPAGFYVVQFSAPGFQTYAITNVPVRSSNVTRLDGRLNVGSVSQTVTVEAAPVVLQTSTASVSVVTKSGISSLSLPPQVSTPRLREYFPETLLWRPEIVTDDKGRAQIKFPLADNITTWKLSAVASTVNGEMGAAEKDIRAFQPFFVEHDPPRFLTVGDEIALPVVLRNYLDRRLQVNVELKPSAWFATLSPTTLKTDVSPQASAQDIFRFRALAGTKDGKQEVSAVGAEASDAISRSVTVRPNGEEKTESVSQVFGDTALLDLTVPDTAISGSVETTLKIYPNLTAHVLESIEAILERPYGCGEQTISSTYPSVLLLRYAKDAGTAPLLSCSEWRIFVLGERRCRLSSDGVRDKVSERCERIHRCRRFCHPRSGFLGAKSGPAGWSLGGTRLEGKRRFSAKRHADRVCCANDRHFKTDC